MLAPTPDVPVTQNPYEYAGQQPTRITDPSGRSWLCVTSDLSNECLVGMCGRR